MKVKIVKNRKKQIVCSGDGQEIFLEKNANKLFFSSGNTRPLSDFDIYDDPLHEKRLIAKNDGPCDVSLIISYF